MRGVVDAAAREVRRTCREGRVGSARVGARHALAVVLVGVLGACASDPVAAPPPRTRQRFSVDVETDRGIEGLRWSLHNAVTLEAYTGTRGNPLSPGETFGIDVGIGSSGPWVLAIVDSTGTRVAAVRCYSIAAGEQVRDDVLLVAGSGSSDADRDGWGTFVDLPCVDPGGGACDHACDDPATVLVDCDDAEVMVSPIGFEICADGLDADCFGGDASCGDADRDGVSSCPRGLPPTPVCDCDDRDPTISPIAPEICADGIDQDCDGRDAFCDLDGDGWTADPRAGLGPDCDDSDPRIYPGAPETDCTVDRDCDGVIGELPECVPDDLDGDGAPACGSPPEPGCDCRDCDPGVHPGAPDRCGDGVDADCDGSDPACASDDADGDGVPTRADCDDADPETFPGAPDRCGDGVAQDCVADRACTDDLDGDGWIETLECDGDASRFPAAAERCDAIDQDCDGTTDELVAAPAWSGTVRLEEGVLGCVRADPRIACGASACPVDLRSALQHCGGCRRDCNEGLALPRADRCQGGRCRCGAGPACPPGRVCCPGGAGCAIPGGCPTT